MKGELLALKNRLDFFKSLAGISEKRKIFLIKLLQELEENIRVMEEKELKLRKKLMPMAYFDFLFIYERPFREFKDILLNYYKLLKDLESLCNEIDKRRKELDKFTRLENALEEFFIPETMKKILRIKRTLEERNLEEIAMRILHRTSK